MEQSQRNLMFLAHNNELIGTIIKTNAGDFTILDYLDYDSMTHTFTFEVQNVNDIDDIRISEFSDKTRYDVMLSKGRRYPNNKRLNPQT